MTEAPLYVGVMSGSSLDGIDVALVSFVEDQPTVLGTHFQAYPESLKQQLLTLHQPSDNELAVSALVANDLSRHYAQAIQTLLSEHNINTQQVSAIGCHGQTIRHQPKLHAQMGYSIQLGNHALLAELTNITVVGDFRARDIAAGGEGAPLVPAFHQAAFGSNSANRVIVNIGGISNISYLSQQHAVIGFDTGPGNMLLDYWTQLHTQQPYDKDGQWASSGIVNTSLLEAFL